MAFFLESTMVGLFFFGWNRLGKVQHLAVTFLVALGSNLSALWILIANGWMQNPVGAEFNHETMRMELVSFARDHLQPGGAGEVRAHGGGGLRHRVDVRARHQLLVPAEGPRRRISRCARSPSPPGSDSPRRLSVIVLGDESGYTTGETQKVKLAVIEAEWETQKPPASFMVFGIPDDRTETSRLRDQRAVGAGPHRHALGRHAGPRHQGAAPRRPSSASGTASRCTCALQQVKAGSKDPDVLRTFETAQGRSRLRAAADAVHRRTWPRPRPTRSRPPRRRPFPAWRRCSGRSA